MNVVWSEEAVCALVALETKLLERYSVEKAARIVEELVRRVDRLQQHPQLGRVVPEYVTGNSASWWTSGIACCTG
jgi:plasmid stabilization system protein ParE